ncbi:hypothetical protein THAOC_30968 [Thalassiosira oceanica]|uniref:Uncharacterized protein n=1 Tax=Thalassiosira oceanica TaxID=159749 RepID=K0RTX2_THAOC|nr:hypothetical protein THAOC_30968 [Thalassiosira oceanica]|eukprot:EJK50097.1 hypothetical protein THAOC_30968 [Thalassiosira oceanica]
MNERVTNGDTRNNSGLNGAEVNRGDRGRGHEDPQRQGHKDSEGRKLMEYNNGGSSGAPPPSGEGAAAADSGDRFLMANISNPHPDNDVLMGRGCKSKIHGPQPPGERPPSVPRPGPEGKLRGAQGGRAEIQPGDGARARLAPAGPPREIPQEKRGDEPLERHRERASEGEDRPAAEEQAHQILCWKLFHDQETIQDEPCELRGYLNFFASGQL